MSPCSVLCPLGRPSSPRPAMRPPLAMYVPRFPGSLSCGRRFQLRRGPCRSAKWAKRHHQGAMQPSPEDQLGVAVEDKHRQFQMPVSRLKDPMPSERSLVKSTRKASARRAYPIIHPYQDATQTPTFSSQASSCCPGPAKSPVRPPGRRVKPLSYPSHTSRASGHHHLGARPGLSKGHVPLGHRDQRLSLTDRGRFA